MGSGVGIYVRVCSRIKANHAIILIHRYSYLFLQKCIKYFKLKLNINFTLL